MWFVVTWLLCSAAFLAGAWWRSRDVVSAAPLEEATAAWMDLAELASEEREKRDLAETKVAQLLDENDRLRGEAARRMEPTP